MNEICQEADRIQLADQLYKLLSSWYAEANQLKSGGQSFAENVNLVDYDEKPVTYSAKSLANSIYEARRIRDDIFGCPEIFGEPAWEMLLDLAVAEEEGNRLSISALCIGSCCASTTALRYIKAMEKSGLVWREEDRDDARRTYIRLSDKGRDMFWRFSERTQITVGEGVAKRGNKPKKLAADG